jgi:hypothetical protein
MLGGCLLAVLWACSPRGNDPSLAGSSNMFEAAFGGSWLWRSGRRLTLHRADVCHHVVADKLDRWNGCGWSTVLLDIGHGPIGYTNRDRIPGYVPS